MSIERCLVASSASFHIDCMYLLLLCTIIALPIHPEGHEKGVMNNDQSWRSDIHISGQSYPTDTVLLAYTSKVRLSSVPGG
jgi:hypothetical protein